MASMRLPIWRRVRSVDLLGDAAVATGLALQHALALVEEGEGLALLEVDDEACMRASTTAMALSTVARAGAASAWGACS